MHKAAIIGVGLFAISSCAMPRATGGGDADASVAMIRAEVETLRTTLVDANAHQDSGRDADASIAALRSQVGELQAGLIAIRSDIRAGRDVNTNDAWTLRLLGMGVLMLGLSYPVGKIVWLAAVTLRRKASRIGGDSSSDLSDVRDYMMMKQKCADLLTTGGAAGERFAGIGRSH